jgi:hypothetical protein
MKPADIQLHIEELMLHGFAPGDRHRIANALQHELARLFAEQGTAVTLAGEVARLDAGAFQMAENASARAIGSQIALAVHARIRR